jgi:hypothetical protein
MTLADRSSDAAGWSLCVVCGAGLVIQAESETTRKPPEIHRAANDTKRLQLEGMTHFHQGEAGRSGETH